MPFIFEAETCSRCGGSGHYSYNQRYGTTCFKCAGQKQVLTKRGAKAQAFFTSLASVRADQLKPGMKIRELGVTVGGDLYNQWVTVVEVKAYDNSGSRSYVNGVEQPKRNDLLSVVANKLTISGVTPETMYRVALTAEQKKDIVELALAYQALLSKSGKEDKILRTIAWG